MERKPRTYIIRVHGDEADVEYTEGDKKVRFVAGWPIWKYCWDWDKLPQKGDVIVGAEETAALEKGK